MDSNMFKALDTILYILVVFAILGVTLGLWKLVELVIWVCQHLHWS